MAGYAVCNAHKACNLLNGFRLLKALFLSIPSVLPENTQISPK